MEPTADTPAPLTTHGQWGSGRPRLRIVRDDERFDHELTADATTIGRASDNAVVLAELDDHHAVVAHVDGDDYVLALMGEGEMSARPDSQGFASGERKMILRTGAHFTLGPWTFTFARDENADHGRPHGGREGGELAEQAPQPPRPDYSGDARIRSLNPGPHEVDSDRPVAMD